MARYHMLRLSLLVALTGCSANTGDGAGLEAETGSGGCPGNCEAPEVVADGFVRCSDGAINRVATGTFEPIIDAQACAGDELDRACSSDADCLAGPNPKCIHTSMIDDEGASISACRCAYACGSDSDCAPGQACVPPGLLSGTQAWPVCKTAGCASNDDCGGCGQCGASAYRDNCNWTVELACRTDQDSCRADADCSPGEACAPTADGTWQCSSTPCDSALSPLSVKP